MAVDFAMIKGLCFLSQIELFSIFAGGWVSSSQPYGYLFSTTGTWASSLARPACWKPVCMAELLSSSSIFILKNVPEWFNYFWYRNFSWVGEPNACGFEECLVDRLTNALWILCSGALCTLALAGLTMQEIFDPICKKAAHSLKAFKRFGWSPFDFHAHVYVSRRWGKRLRDTGIFEGLSRGSQDSFKCLWGTFNVRGIVGILSNIDGSKSVLKSVYCHGHLINFSLSE